MIHHIAMGTMILDNISAAGGALGQQAMIVNGHQTWL
jgi:hypothetical protein